MLDFKALEALKETDKASPGFLKMLIDMFKDTSKENLDGIHEGVDEGDSEKIWKAAHSLKSSSAVLGAFKVSELAAQIEALGVKGDLESIKPLASDLNEFREASLSELNIYIKELNPQQ